MKVVLISAFRNAERYIKLFTHQIFGLKLALDERGDELEMIVGEGDSTDDTRAMLADYLTFVPTTIVDCTHGGPTFGPVVSKQRFKQLAYVGNQMWRHIPDDADAIIQIESDLIWQPQTITRLLSYLAEVPCVAPLITEQGYWFYDIWAYRRGGQHFWKMPPFHPDIAGTDLLELDSAGSCLVMNAAIARQMTWPEEDVIVGICRQIRALGASVWLAPSLAVDHA